MSVLARAGEPDPVADPDDTDLDPEASSPPVADDEARAEPSRAPGSVLGPLVVALLALAAYATLSVRQWQRMETPSWDLAIFTQLARRYSQLEAPIVTVKGADFNLLGDHFHPLLVLLGVPYRFAASGLTVMLVQDVLLAFSVWVIARAAVRRLGVFTGTLVGAAYAVSFGLVGAVAVQFHEVAFAVPLLALSLVALLDGRWTTAALWAAPLVLVKEDLGATVVAIGAVLWWRARDADRGTPAASLRGRRLGIGLAVWGAVWLVVTQKVILPALNPDGQYAYAGRLDLGDLLRHPWMMAVHLVDDQRKLATLALLVLACGVVGLRSPIMLVAVPTLLWRFWSPNYGFWGYTWHYSAVLMPVAFVALLDGVRLAEGSSRAWLRRLGTVGVAISVTAAVVMTPRLALGRLADPELWKDNPNAAAAQRVLDEIPDGASVETDLGLITFLVPDHDVYWFGNTGNPAPDYVVFSRAPYDSPAAQDDVVTWAQEAHPGTTYRLADVDGGFVVVERTDG